MYGLHTYLYIFAGFIVSIYLYIVIGLSLWKPSIDDICGCKMKKKLCFFFVCPFVHRFMLLENERQAVTLGTANTVNTCKLQKREGIEDKWKIFILISP